MSTVPANLSPESRHKLLVNGVHSECVRAIAKVREWWPETTDEHVAEALTRLAEKYGAEADSAG